MSFKYCYSYLLALHVLACIKKYGGTNYYHIYITVIQFNSKIVIFEIIILLFYRTIPDPSSQKLKWMKPPLTVLVVKKMHDDSVLSAFKRLVTWLVEVCVVFYAYKVQ